MKSIQNFTSLKLSNEKMIKLIGGDSGPISGTSTGTTIPSLPSNIYNLGSAFTVGQTVSNPLVSSAMLVGNDISFGTTGGQITISHEATHVAQSR